MTLLCEKDRWSHVGAWNSTVHDQDAFLSNLPPEEPSPQHKNKELPCDS